MVELAANALRILSDGHADVPATPELAPRPGAFVHAMPAYLEEDDVTALKWISGFPANRERGLPYLSGLIVVNDSETGLPLAIMDCAAITAARTAAVSAVCAQRFASSGWSQLVLLGYGVQARAHIKLFRELFPSLEVRVVSRREKGRRDGISFGDDARRAIAGADVVITGIPLELTLQPRVVASWLAEDALVLPLDDDASLDASVANDAARFYVDDLDDFEMRRNMGRFVGWRSPDATVATVLAADHARDAGVIVCANQGMGILDAVFAAAVLRRAEREQVGDLLLR